MKLTNQKMSVGDWVQLGNSFGNLSKENELMQDKRKKREDEQAYESAFAQRSSQLHSPAVAEGYGLDRIPEGAAPVEGMPWTAGQIPGSLQAAKANADAELLYSRSQEFVDKEARRKATDAALKLMAGSKNPGDAAREMLNSPDRDMNQVLGVIDAMNEVSRASTGVQEIEKIKQAEKEMLYAAVQETAQLAENARQRGDYETAARLLEKTSDRMNIPYRYVHDGKGAMDVYYLDKTTNEYVMAAGAAGKVPVDEALDALLDLQKEEFVREYEKNEVAVRTLNETDLKPVWRDGQEYILHTIRDTKNLANARFVVWDPKTKKEVEVFETFDELRKSNYMTEEDATSSAKVAEAQGEVTLTNAKILSERELAAKRSREARGGGRKIDNATYNSVYSRLEKEFGEPDGYGGFMADQPRIRIGVMAFEDAYGAGLSQARAEQYGADMGRVLKSDDELIAEARESLSGGKKNARVSDDDVLSKAEEMKLEMIEDVNSLRAKYFGQPEPQEVGGLPDVDGDDAAPAPAWANYLPPGANAQAQVADETTQQAPEDLARKFGPPIDVSKRAGVKNPDGTFSTVKSISINVDGAEVLIPTLTEDGVQMSEEEAVQRFFETGEHLGAFATVEEATAAAKNLSQAQGVSVQAAPAIPSAPLPGLGGAGYGLQAAQAAESSPAPVAAQAPATPNVSGPGLPPAAPGQSPMNMVNDTVVNPAGQKVIESVVGFVRTMKEMFGNQMPVRQAHALRVSEELSAKLAQSGALSPDEEALLQRELQILDNYQRSVR